MKIHWSIWLSTALALAPLSWSATTTTPDSNTNKPAARVSSSKKLDLNSATKAELQTLPGVGASTADSIIAARPFKSVNDLKDVKGIGATRFDQIRPLVTVHASAHSTSPASSSSAAAADSHPSSKTTTASSATASPAASGKSAEKNPSGTTTAQARININTASLEELDSLPGIGPVKAQAIIDNRPYKNIEDVMKVKGIKESAFSEIKDRIRTH